MNERQDRRGVLKPDFGAYDGVESQWVAKPSHGEEAGELTEQPKAQALHISLPQMSSIARPLAQMWRGATDVARAVLGGAAAITTVALFGERGTETQLAIAAISLVCIYALHIAGREERRILGSNENREDPLGSGCASRDKGEA